MRITTLVIGLVLVVNVSFSQSKKETEAKINQLEEKINQLEGKVNQLEEKNKNLENEVANVKTNLTNTTTTLSLVSKSNLDLEKLVQEDKKLIEKLIQQNDSLLALSKVKKEETVIIEPKNEEDSVIFMIQSYYACKKWEDRLEYVLNGNEIKQYMKEYYANSYKASAISKKDVYVQGSGFKPNEVFTVLVYDRKFYCKRLNDGFKIDWMASAGYNPVSLRTFEANLSTQPTEFRVTAKIGAYYNYKYSNAQNTQWSVLVDDGDRRPYCYVDKNSTAGKKLYEIIKDGKEHDVILEIKTEIENSYGSTIGHFIITKVVSEGWVK